MRLVAGLLLLLALGCDKPSSGGAPSASASVATAASSAPAAASAAATPKSAAATQSWRGTYKSAAATLTAPPGKKTHWSDTPSMAGIGDGTLVVTVDGATGQVSGTVDGPLGPATVDGVLANGKLTATLRRKDPGDQGFTGTVLGSIATGHLEGAMNLSAGLAGALRTATFILTPSGAAP